MSNTTSTLFPDEPRPQSQNCIVDLGNPWNYWQPYGPWPSIQVYPWWTTLNTSTAEPTPVQAKPAEQVNEEPKEEPEQTDEDECLTLTMNDLETMVRRVIKEELGSLRIVQGNE